MVKYRKNLCK